MECELCQQPASHTYTLSARTLNLCDRCFDRYEIQDAYEQRLPEIEQLTMNEDYEKALTLLQAILDVHAKRDHDSWLENSILSHQGLILTEQGRFTEALEK
jgi:hypothetical protein